MRRIRDLPAQTSLPRAIGLLLCTTMLDFVALRLRNPTQSGK